MRNRVVSLLAGLALLTLPAFAVQPQRSVASAPAAIEVPTGGVLYDQTDNLGTDSISSQNFEAALDTFDNSGADDFEVPAGLTWSVTGVFVPGVYFSGTGPAPTVDVTFYADNAGLPGAVECTNAAVVPADVLGSFTITLPVACELGEGPHWLSVVANMEFALGGQWGWTERTVQGFNPSAWQNPGGGFATACTTWGPRVSLCAVGTAPDFAFNLVGSEATAVSLIEVPTLGTWGMAALALLLAAGSVMVLRRRKTA